MERHNHLGGDPVSTDASDIGTAPLRASNVRAAWFTLAIDIYRSYEKHLDGDGAESARVGAVRRLKAARPAILHILRDAELGETDRAYLEHLLSRVERYFIHIPLGRAAA